MGKDLTPDAAAVVYTALFDKVHPLAIGALEQSWALSIQVARQALETHMDPEVDKAKIDHIVDRLSDHYKSHLYQLNRREAAALGLPVKHASAEEEDAMWTLHQAFAGTAIQGETEIGGQKMTSIGLGYITSQAGVTIGLGHAKANKTDEGIVATTWESKVGPDRPMETPPAAPPSSGRGVPSSDVDGARCIATTPATLDECARSWNDCCRRVPPRPTDVVAASWLTFTTMPSMPLNLPSCVPTLTWFVNHRCRSASRRA